MPPSDPRTPVQWRSAAAESREGERSRNAALWRGLDHAHMMQVELIAALLIWGGAGWLVDRWLDSGPWLTVLGALVGYAAGFYLIWIRSQRMDAEDAAERAAVTAQGAGAPPRGGFRGA
ncbi:MAG: AtpZ/AtpI family protein [Nitriliruptoraceae bacterium]